MSRRTTGEGSITQRKDGRWQAAVQVGGKRATVYGRTKSEAAEKLRTLTTQARTTGQLPQAGRLTVGEYLSEWLEQAEGHLRPKTHLDYSIMARNHITPALGTTRLSKVSPLQLARYCTSLGKTLSPRRVRMVYDLLHKALGDAARWGLIAANPAATVEAPKRESREPELWTPEQATAFLQAMQGGEGGQYGNLLAFLLASGCRVGEAAGLRWPDVDWDRQSVRVERQITEVAGKPVELPPKTRSGVRTITLPSWGLEMLKRQRVQVAGWKLRAGADWQGGDRVFPTNVGTVPLQGNVRRSLHEACRRLGLPRLRVHDLRHLHLSLLAMSGVPVKVAQARAGHSTPAITMRVYQHVIGDPDRKAADALEAVLG